MKSLDFAVSILSILDGHGRKKKRFLFIAKYHFPSCNGIRYLYRKLRANSPISSRILNADSLPIAECRMRQGFAIDY